MASSILSDTAKIMRALPTVIYKLIAVSYANLPRNVSKKRAILNLLFYAIKSIHTIFKRFDSRETLEEEKYTGSKIWDTFQRYIYLYNILFEDKYLLQGYIIKYAEGGYAAPYFNNPEKPVLTPVEIDKIPKFARQAIDNVAEISANRFIGVKKEGMSCWQQKYQFSPTVFDLPNKIPYIFSYQVNNGMYLIQNMLTHYKSRLSIDTNSRDGLW